MSQNNPIITWEDFNKIDLRVGTIVQAEVFPEAKKAAFILYVDLGKEIGICKSSAQITDLYTVDSLLGKQVVCVTNFPTKQIGPMRSEVLVTGFPDKDGKIVLCTSDKIVENGVKLL